jgi:leucyl aminopeptidase
MAIAFVAGSALSLGASTSTTVTSTAISANVGDTIIFIAGNYSAFEISSVSDNCGRTYTKAGDTLTSGDGRYSCWYCANIGSHANNSSLEVTATFAGTSNYRVAAAAAYSGVSTSSPYHAQSSGKDSSGTTHTTNTVTTTQADALIVAIYTCLTFAKNLSATPPNAIRANYFGDYALADRLATTTGDYSVEITSDDSTDYACKAWAFVPPSSGAGLPKSLGMLLRGCG